MNNRRAPAAIASRLSLTVAICLLAPELPASQETPPAPPGNSVELIVNKHHGGAVALDLSSDGRFFVLPNGTTLELWDAIKGRRIRTFGGFRDDVFSAAISRDGKRVAAGTSELGESEIYVWDTETGRVDAKWRVLAVQNWGSGKPYSTTAALTFSADGRQIIAVGNFNNRELKDSTISLEIARILDIATGRLLNSIEIAGSSHARSVALALDGRTFAVGFQGGVTRRYDLNGRLVGVINSPDTTGAVDSVAFSPSGRLLALGNASYPKKSTDVEIRDVRSGRLVRTIPSDRTGRAVGIAWAPDGTTIAIGGAFGLQVWDVESGSLKGENNGVYARGVRYKPDGSEIFTPGYLLDARTLKSKKAFGEDVTYLLGASASSREALVPAGNCRLYAIDVLTGAISKYFERTATDGICPLGSLSGDGRTSCAWVIDRAVNNSRSVIFSNLSIGATTKTLATDTLCCPSMSEDGSRIAVKRSSGAIDVFDTGSGAVWRSVPGKPGHRHFALSPDGQRLVAVEDDSSGSTYVWDLASGAASRLGQYNLSTDSSTPSVLVFSPDSRFVIMAGTSSSHYSIDYWDVERRQRVHQLSLANDTMINFGGVGFHPDGDKVLVGSWDSKIRLWDLNSGQLIRTYSGHAATPWRTRFAAGGRRLVSHDMHDLKIWNPDTGESLLSIYVMYDGEWLEITPEGFFDASPNGARILSAVRGVESYSIDQFYQALYRPDLVREKLAGDPRGRVKQAAASLGLNIVVGSGNAPAVRLASPGNIRGAGRAEASAAVEAEIIDQGGGIGRVEWRVNGVTAGIDSPAPAPGRQPVRLTRSLLLDPGDSRIEVVAYNAADLIASPAALLNVTVQAPSPSSAKDQPTFPSATPEPVAAARQRLFVLTGGINDYADERIRLSYAVPDAKEVARAFKEAGGLYQSVEVKLMTDSEVNRDRLEVAFGEIAAKARPSDVFVLYLAGHGKTVDGRYHFIPQDFTVDGELTDRKVDAAAKARAITQEQLQRWLALIPARRSVILFDTCDSGTLVGGGSEIQELEKAAANDRVAQATGRSTITASTGSQQALEGYHGHGLFTYGVLDAINGADSDGNGSVEVTELAAYVYAQVSELSQRVFRQRQAPQMRIRSDFSLARQKRILQGEIAAVATAKPAYQVSQAAKLQIKPGVGQTVVRSLSAKTEVTVVEAKDGWALIASEGRPIGYVAATDLVPVR